MIDDPDPAQRKAERIKLQKRMTMIATKAWDQIDALPITKPMIKRAERYVANERIDEMKGLRKIMGIQMMPIIDQMCKL